MISVTSKHYLWQWTTDIPRRQLSRWDNDQMDSALPHDSIYHLLYNCFADNKKTNVQLVVKKILWNWT